MGIKTGYSRSLSLAVGALLFLALPLSGLAEEKSPPYSLSLKELLQEALSKNPAIQEARARWKAAKNRIAIEGWLDDPMVGADVEGIPKGSFDFDERMNVEYMISQMIPFPGKLSLKGKIARQEANIAYEMFREKERKIIQEVKTAYQSLLLLDRSIAINQRNKERVNAFRRIAESRYVGGLTYRQDLLKSEVELSRLLNEETMLGQERAIAVARLNALLNQPPQTPIALSLQPGNIPHLFSWEELEQHLMENRPELKMAEIEIDKMKSEKSLAKLSYAPDFLAKVEARQFNGESDIREYDAFLGITLPIWFWKNSAAVREASESLTASKEAYTSLKNMILFEAQDAWARLQAKEQQAKRYKEEILPQAEEAFEEARKGYESGTSMFLDLLDAQRMLNMFEMDYTRTVAEYEIARADLERSVGTPLDDEIIFPEEKIDAKKK